MVEVEEELGKTPEVGQVFQLIENIQDQEFEEYFKRLTAADFMDVCSLVPARERMVRLAISLMAGKGKKFELAKVSKNLMF